MNKHLVLAVFLMSLFVGTTQATPSPFNGTWRRSDGQSTVTISVHGTSVTLIYTPGTPDAGTLENNKITYRGVANIGTATTNEGTKTVQVVSVGAITLSADGKSIIKRRTFLLPGGGEKSETDTYYRVK